VFAVLSAVHRLPIRLTAYDQSCAVQVTRVARRWREWTLSVGSNAALCESSHDCASTTPVRWPCGDRLRRIQTPLACRHATPVIKLLATYPCNTSPSACRSNTPTGCMETVAGGSPTAHALVTRGVTRAECTCSAYTVWHLWTPCNEQPGNHRPCTHTDAVKCLACQHSMGPRGWGSLQLLEPSPPSTVRPSPVWRRALRRAEWTAMPRGSHRGPVRTWAR
jgi:hypothetical protein